jgi:O-methyltransferase involved in polyketide biosynthesis
MSENDQIETPKGLKNLKNPKKLRLHPTAALVILWSLPLYARGPPSVRKFVEMLDLSSGKDLFRRCNAICNWYDEVILNRKHFIKSLIESLLDEFGVGKEAQIVILAAGKSPLALELLIGSSSRIAQIFEVDLAGIEEKKQLYSGLAPDIALKLRCLTTDVTSDELLDRLVEEGFDPETTTIVLMEGISYYLPKKDLEGIVSKFGSGGRNRFIVEYLVPCSEVKSARRTIPKGIFSLIRKEAGTEGTICYTELELSRIFQRSGGREISCTDMSEMERLRLGFNRHFCERRDGWIEGFLGEV